MIDIISYFVAGMALVFLIVFPFFPISIQWPIQYIVVLILVGCILLAGVGFGIYAMQQSSEFWFLGVLRDKVGTTGLEQDRRADLQFAMKISPELKGKQLQSVQIELFDPLNKEQPVKVGSTKDEDQWKLALNQYNPKTLRWDYVHLPQTIDQHLMIYMGNPYRDRYVPKGTYAQIEFEYADGSQVIRKCDLPSQNVY